MTVVEAVARLCGLHVVVVSCGWVGVGVAGGSGCGGWEWGWVGVGVGVVGGSGCGGWEWVWWVGVGVGVVGGNGSGCGEWVCTLWSLPSPVQSNWCNWREGQCVRQYN